MELVLDLPSEILTRGVDVVVGRLQHDHLVDVDEGLRVRAQVVAGKCTPVLCRSW